MMSGEFGAIYERKRGVGWLVWRVWLLLVWGTWWGGLTFYAAVVVPAGTAILGSIEQGFVTQQVTRWHNGLFALLLVSLILEAFRVRSRALVAVVTFLAVLLIGLLAWHARLTSMMSFGDRAVSDTFYGEHAVYLWLTAAEWAIGMALPFWLLGLSVKGDDSR